MELFDVEVGWEAVGWEVLVVDDPPAVALVVEVVGAFAGALA
jgi:hypothetical protein